MAFMPALRLASKFVMDPRVIIACAILFLYLDRERLQDNNEAMATQISNLEVSIGLLATKEDLANEVVAHLERREELRASDDDAVNEIINEAYRATPEENGPVAPVLRDAYDGIDRLFEQSGAYSGSSDPDTDNSGESEGL